MAKNALRNLWTTPQKYWVRPNTSNNILSMLLIIYKRPMKFLFSLTKMQFNVCTSHTSISFLLSENSVFTSRNMLNPIQVIGQTQYFYTYLNKYQAQYFLHLDPTVLGCPLDGGLKVDSIFFKKWDNFFRVKDLLEEIKSTSYGSIKIDLVF